MGKRKINDIVYYQCDYTGMPMRTSNCYIPSYSVAGKLLKHGSYCCWEAVIAASGGDTNVQALVDEIVGCAVAKAPDQSTLSWLSETGAIANIDEFLAACDDPNKPVHVIEIAVDGRLTEAVIARRAYMGFTHRFTTMRKKGKEKAYEVCFNGVGAPNTAATQYFKQELSGTVYVALKSKELAIKERSRYLPLDIMSFKTMFSSRKRKVDALDKSDYESVKTEMNNELMRVEAQAAQGSEKPTDLAKAAQMPPASGAMVKRTRDPMQVALSRVQPRASINPDAGSAKHDQAYMYPNGIIKRAPSVMLNGRYYTDPRGDNHRTANDGDMQRDAQGSNTLPRGVAAGQPRRSIESNFLLTINPNRKWGTDGTGHDPTAQQIFRQTLDRLCENANFLTCLRVPTKTRAQPDYSAHFQNDALHFTDVIVNVDAKGTIEVGEKQKRMHAHMVIEIKHYSMLQLNPPVIRSLFKEIWNEICEQPAYAQYELNAMPYVDVQLLKQNNAMDIIKAYVRKSVGPVSTPDINL